MGQIDSYTKEYMDDAEIFADAFNYYIYGGEQVIDPAKLRSLDTTAIAVPYGNADAGTPVQKYRDIFKALAEKQDDQAIYLILGAEMQANIHYAMPVKNMNYDSIAYAQQVEKASKSHRTALKNECESKTEISEGEFLSGFYKSDKLIPVITLVVYWGADEWDGPMSLHEMMAVQDQKILRFVPDYQLNLISPYGMDEDELKKLKTNLKEVMSYIKYSKDKLKLKELVNNDEIFKKLDNRAARVIGSVTRTKIKINESAGETDMCQAIAELQEDAKIEEKIEIVKKLIKLGKNSYEEIAIVSGLSVEEIKKIEAE